MENNFNLNKLKELFKHGKISRATFYRCKAQKRMPCINYHQPKVRNAVDDNYIFNFFVNNEKTIKGIAYNLCYAYDASTSIVDDLINDTLLKMIDRGEVSFTLIKSKMRDLLRGSDAYRRFVKWRYFKELDDNII